MAYKIEDEELDVVVQEWSVEWRDPMSMEEISMGSPTDAPNDLVQEWKIIHDSNGEL